MSNSQIIVGDSHNGKTSLKQPKAVSLQWEVGAQLLWSNLYMTYSRRIEVFDLWLSLRWPLKLAGPPKWGELAEGSK